MEDRTTLKIDDLKTPYDRNEKSRMEAMGKILKTHPPLQCEPQFMWDRWFNAKSVPVLFIVGWALIFVLVVLDKYSGFANVIQVYGLQVIFVLLVGIASLVVGVQLGQRTR